MARLITVGVFVSLALLVTNRADAIPLFSHQYAVTCQKCHTVIPRLNAFGEHFYNGGYRINGVTAPAVFPVSIKINFAASTANQGTGPGGAGLPKAIVDEIELFTAGTIGSRANYFFEQYVVDGGEPGRVRDAWVQYRANAWQARVPLVLQAGSFTLPLPVDPETFRETFTHYAVYDQAIGANPFTFFDPKSGIELGVGSALHGAALRAFAGPGHDRGSDLSASGIDSMISAQQVFGPLTISAYRYAGQRAIGEATLDRFWRSGYAAVFGAGRWTSENVVQTGRDSNVNGGGDASSGAFSQLRYAMGPRAFALARYDATNDRIAGPFRDVVVLFGYRPAHNSRITIEDVMTAAPLSSHTLNAQLTVAY